MACLHTDAPSRSSCVLPIDTLEDRYFHKNVMGNDLMVQISMSEPVSASLLQHSEERKQHIRILTYLAPFRNRLSLYSKVKKHLFPPNKRKRSADNSGMIIFGC